MKVAILAPIAHPIPPTTYGPWEKVVYTQAEGLSKEGIDVTVIGSSHTQGNFKTIVTVDKLTEELEPQYRFAHELHHIAEAQKIIREGDYDIIHNHLNWYGFLALLHTGKPFVSTLHGMEEAAKFIYEDYKSQNFISISNALRKQKPHINYVATVYNGIDFNFFALEQKKENYFFVASRIIGQKGIHYAIEIAKKTNIPLIIAGVIDDESYFNEKVKPHIDNNLIKYIGQISQTEVHNYASKALAYMSMLDWDEPFGLSVAEAIACGTPVIATPRGSMPELVKDGISGIIVNSVEEAVQRIEEVKNIDPKTCREFGHNLFSIEKMIEGYVNVYKKILNKG